VRRHIWPLLVTTLAAPNAVPQARAQTIAGTIDRVSSEQRRLEGHADIGGQRTLVSLPLNIVSGSSSVKVGWIGLDANGDGKIDQQGFSGPEVIWSSAKPSLFRVAGQVVSVESVDPAARTFVLREHPLSAYKYVDLHVGDPMPAFSFTDFDGRPRQLSDFRGKYVLLDFWGTWCGPCLAEFPTLRTARERFADRGFEILGIDYEKGVTWPNAAPDSVRELVEDVLRITAFPSKILVGPDGKVVAFISFEVTGGGLLQRLDSLIRQGAMRRPASAGRAVRAVHSDAGDPR